MSQTIQNHRMTLLAGVCLLSLSACSSKPINDPDSRIGNAADRIGDASSNLWVKTKHVFRLDGTDAYHPENNTAVDRTEIPGQYKDELDMVLVQEDLVPGSAVGESIEIIPTTDSSAIALETIDAEQPARAGDEIPELALSETEVIEVPELIITENAVDEDGTPAPRRRIVLADRQYEVQDNENLWDISKRLTGDATNWRDLAALNSLDKDGAVYAGQTLHVPGDMLRQPEEPSLAAATPATGSETQTVSATVQNAGATPTKVEAVEAVSEIVVAETELPKVDAGPRTSFKVLAGESLWDMAKRTTGDATNWKTIAAANGMTAEQAAFIKYGQTLEIPNALLKVGVIDAPAATVAASPEKKPVAAATVTAETTPAATATESAAATPVAVASTETTAPAASEAEMTIMPANYKADPPVIESAAQPAAAASTPVAADSVMVSGTYYPKAIYNDANFSATLLMRVSPGTELKVSRAIGPWFEVKTDKGIGYVHSRDIK